MVNNVLHVICGNCGCNNEWVGRFDIDPDGSSHPDGYTFCLSCQNCATLHPVSELFHLEEQ
jgi:hypothetical protein